MKICQHILLLLLIHCLVSAVPGDARSIGKLRFEANGKLYTADSTHARGYAVKQTSMAYINGASKDMVIGIEWKGMKGPGIYSLDSRTGKVEFSINHKSYSPKQDGDYLKIIVRSIKQQGTLLLFNGSFEGQLQDRAGNKLKITAGSFETISL